MNLVIFLEGTGQGVYGKKTNVALIYEDWEPEELADEVVAR